MPQVTQSMITTWNNKASKAVATQQAAGLMSAADKKKLDNLAGGGSGGISGDYVISVNGKSGVVTLSKSDVGLGNVDNTADAQKEVLSATKLQTARKIIIGSSEKNFNGSADVSWSLTEIGAAEKEHTHNYEPANVNIQSHISNNNNPHSVTKTQVGLGNVVNVDTSNPANIAWSASYRTVTDTEKTTWNGKQNALGYTAENSVNKKTAWQATPDNTSYPSEKLVKDSLDLKVDKVTGKQLSTEDYTTAEKTKLSGIAAGANNYVHPTGDGYSHIPATGTTNNGKVLKAGATANSASWGNVDWSEIANKPTTFTPTAHNHAISEVTNLQTSLDAKVNTSDVVTTATANKILKLDANAKLPANITGNADGNAATATKLQTARTINGVSFDGSANITIPKIHSRGLVTCETGTNRPALSGVSTQSCYGNGYPITYGEVLTLDNVGSAQLLLGWSVGNATAPAYIRSKRDISDSLWSDWHMIYTTAYKPSLADLGAASSSHAHTSSEIGAYPINGGNLSGNINLVHATPYIQFNSGSYIQENDTNFANVLSYRTRDGYNHYFRNGQVFVAQDKYVEFQANSTWGAKLRVGGNGYTAGRDALIASVVTTNGNLHLDSGSDKAMLLNYYSGTGGIIFGNGNQGQIASLDASGNFSCSTVSAATFTGTLSGNATGGSKYIYFDDSDRNPNNILPNAHTRFVSFSFAQSSYLGTGGTYGGVMTFNPWSGTTASTGDASYQLAFGSSQANAGGIPRLRLRKGIDTTWENWYEIYHSGNKQPVDWSEVTSKPSSMPASDVYAWAKASTKPSYTYSEVGAVPQRVRTNWNSDNASLNSVVGQLAWKNYGNHHTIFDASAGTSPDGTAIDLYDAAISWSPAAPTLMGWNGANTYGVRVDSAKTADYLMGYTINSSGRHNVANEIVRTDNNGYIQAGWINTTSGDNGTTAISRIYASSDGYIRYYTPANFISTLNLVKGDDARLSDARTPLSHGHSVATQAVAGFMSAADKTTLDSLSLTADKVISYTTMNVSAYADATIANLKRQPCTIQIVAYAQATTTVNTTGLNSKSNYLEIDNGLYGSTYNFKISEVSKANYQWRLTKGVNANSYIQSLRVALIDNGSTLNLILNSSSSTQIRVIAIYD